jgi:hypothetical protein
MTVMVAAPFISPDEKAYALVEVNLGIDYIGKRRIQIVYVNRGDELAEWRKDLGPADSFTSNQFRIPALWEHTVGELWDIAEQQRLKEDEWERFIQEEQQASTLISDWLTELEERNKLARNQSTFGPGYTRQRNGVSRWR